MNDICVVIPTYNSPYIDSVLQDLSKYDYTVIVVDDGSIIPLEIDKYDVIKLKHPQNMGKGEAILTGGKKAKELGFDRFVVMDADGQHLASEIKKLFDAYEDDCIVVGCRDFSSENVPNSSKFGRAFSNFWVMVETFKNLKDTQSGFRIYPISILELDIKNKRFDFEIEVLVLHSYRGGKIKDVDVLCYYPPQEQRVSHFDKTKDNIRLSLLHSRLTMQRFFLLRGFLWN